MFHRRFRLFLIGLITLSALLLLPTTGRQERAQADRPNDPEMGLPAGDFAARVYYEEIVDIDRLAAYDVWEYNNLDKRYVLVGANRYIFERLISEGWRVVVDEEATAALQRQTELFTYYGGYRTVDEIYSDVAAIQADHPDLTEIVVYGESYCKLSGGCVTLGGDVQPGYDLQAVRVTNQNIPGPKPIFFLMANLHAREITTYEIALRMLDWLVEGYGVNPDATWLVDYHEVWIVPTANPDGLWLVQLGTMNPYNGNPFLQRKNANQTNGCTTWTPNGFEQYGVDLNRNHSFAWGDASTSTDPCSTIYRGPESGSEVEVAFLETLIAAIIPDQRGPLPTDAAPEDTTGILITLHSFSNLVLWPWGHTADPAPNKAGLQAIGDKLATYNNYLSCQPPLCLYAASGITEDWAYGQLGIPAYTFEIGSSSDGFFPPYSQVDADHWPRNGPALQYAAKIAATPYMTTFGPDALELMVEVGTENGITLTAVIDDTKNGGQNIAAAEFSIGAPHWITDTETYSMLPIDSNFDSSVEVVTAVVDLSHLPAGQHSLFVRGQDDEGHWGPVSAVFVHIPSPAPPDLELHNDDGGVMVYAGETILYTLTYTNATAQIATGVVITNTIPTHTTFNEEQSTLGWDCPPAIDAETLCTFAVGSLLGSASGSVAFALTLDEFLPFAVTAITNTAIIGHDGAQGIDPTPENNSASTTTAVIRTVRWEGNGPDANWTTLSNWLNNTLPIATDMVLFEGTKSALVDSPVVIYGLHMADTYSGVITQTEPLSVTGVFTQAGGLLIVDANNPVQIGGLFNQTGGRIQQTQTVNNAIVPFLELTDAQGVIKYRGVEIDTTSDGHDLGSVTVTIRRVDGLTHFCTDNDENSPLYTLRCFEITPDHNHAATVRLWLEDSERNGIDLFNLRPYRYEPPTWQLLTAFTNGSEGNFVYTQGYAPGFSSFLAGSDQSPTAVTLLYQGITRPSDHLPWFVGLLLLALIGWIGVTAVGRRPLSAVTPGPLSPHPVPNPGPQKPPARTEPT